MKSVVVLSNKLHQLGGAAEKLDGMEKNMAKQPSTHSMDSGSFIDSSRNEIYLDVDTAQHSLKDLCVAIKRMKDYHQIQSLS
jgi:hypothetical protein